MDEYCHKEIYSYKALKTALGINGFSLIELLIAMAVGLIILGATYSVFISQNKQMDKQDKIVELQQNVRAAIDMMSREVRMAGYNPTPCPGACPAPFDGITYNTAQLQIKANFSGGSAVGSGAANEIVIYKYDSANFRITRNNWSSSGSQSGDQPFAENIIPNDNGIPLFSYLDKNGNATATSSAIRKVRLTITGRTSSPIDGIYPKYTLSADVYVRNPAD